MDIDKAAERRLTDFIDLIGGVLQYPQRRESFAQYALGLMGDERKSIEAIAMRNCRAWPDHNATEPDTDDHRSTCA